MSTNTNSITILPSGGKYTYPQKLRSRDEVRVISPSFSMAKWPKETIEIATQRFRNMGLVVSFGKNVNELNCFDSSSIKSRIDDLTAAFLDPNVKGVVCSSGGYNSNELLDNIDWKIIKNNPKFFCGFSDITVLSNAILSKTGLITYSGPNFRNFGQKLYFDYTQDYFSKIAFTSDPITLKPSNNWSDDKWIKNQNKRKLIPNLGWWLINPGNASGTIIGGNLCSLNLLQGTNYQPSLKDTILMIEDDDMSTVGEFSRNWQSIMHLPDFKEIRGIIFGRFQKKTKMTKKLLSSIIKNSPKLQNIPVIANVDFGHTDPKITFPIGGFLNINLQ